MQKISTCLWFDTQAEEAAKFYTSLFDNSRVTGITYYGEGGPAPAGSVLTVRFELEGREFTALNGGPHFSFTEAVSMVITCSSQDEIDRYWDALAAGGEIQQCGWLKDRYGLSWQVVPGQLDGMLRDPDRASRVMQALMPMRKLDLAVLQEAYNKP